MADLSYIVEGKVFISFGVGRKPDLFKGSEQGVYFLHAVARAVSEISSMHSL